MLLAITFMGSDVKIHLLIPDILLRSFTATYPKLSYVSTHHVSTFRFKLLQIYQPSFANLANCKCNQQAKLTETVVKNMG